LQLYRFIFSPRQCLAPLQDMSILNSLPLWSLKTPLQMRKVLGLMSPVCCNWGHCCSAVVCWTLCPLCWGPPGTCDAHWRLQARSPTFLF